MFLDEDYISAYLHFLCQKISIDSLGHLGRKYDEVPRQRFHLSVRFLELKPWEETDHLEKASVQNSKHLKNILRTGKLPKLKITCCTSISLLPSLLKGSC